MLKLPTGFPGWFQTLGIRATGSTCRFALRDTPDDSSGAMRRVTLLLAVLVALAGCSDDILSHAEDALPSSVGDLTGSYVLNGIDPQVRGYYYQRYYGPPAVDESVGVEHGKSARRFTRWPVRLIVRPPRLTRNKAKKRRDRA